MKDLYSYRDRFFETHTIEKAVEKRELVEHKMREVLDELDNLTRKKTGPWLVFRTVGADFQKF